MPLLLPDAPVVVWWPGGRAGDPGQGPARRARPAPGHRRGGRRATRRRLVAALAAALPPGDTDLAWTRITPWRSLLAAALDQPHPHDHRGRWSRASRATRAPSCSPRGWRCGWAVPVVAGRLRRARHHRRSGCGTTDGDIAVARPDGRARARCPGRASPTGRSRCTAARDRRDASPRSCAGSTRTRSTARRWRPSLGAPAAGPSCAADTRAEASAGRTALAAERHERGGPTGRRPP